MLVRGGARATRNERIAEGGTLKRDMDPQRLFPERAGRGGIWGRSCSRGAQTHTSARRASRARARLAHRAARAPIPRAYEGGAGIGPDHCHTMSLPSSPPEHQ